MLSSFITTVATPREVAGAEFALEDRHLRRRRIDVVALRLARVHHGLVGREHMRHAGRLQLLAVGGEGAQVAVEVLAGTELPERLTKMLAITQSACSPAWRMSAIWPS